ILEIKGYGGAILHELLYDIAGNFCEENTGSLDRLRKLRNRRSIDRISNSQRRFCGHHRYGKKNSVGQIPNAELCSYRLWDCLATAILFLDCQNSERNRCQNFLSETYPMLLPTQSCKSGWNHRDFKWNRRKLFAIDRRGNLVVSDS